MNGNVIRTITIRGTSEGLDKVTADLNKLASAQENVAVVSEQSAKRVLSLEDAWKRQTLKLDEAARAQANIARETKIADAALREGLATQAQHAQRLEQINQRYTTAGKATQDFGKQTGLARHELINLGRQAQDVGVSLVSGQSPLMVLAQQGSQIADVFISSGKSVGSFFSQAIEWAGRFFTSTAGIVTAIGAIGAAAVYMASQFLKSSTTVEQALAEQKRLMDENNTAVGGLIEAQIRLQSTALTRFQSLENELDLWVKLRSAMEDAARVAERRVTKPAQVPGEMGEAPTGLTPLKDPGFAQINQAIQALRANMEAGRPGIVAFMNELGRIGEVTPEARKMVAELTRAGQESMVLEAAALKASAALKSVAQQTLGALQIKEAGEATERMAAATLELAARYPGMSTEVAKQLEALKGQETVASSIGEIGRINAQYEADINRLKLEGKTLSEQIAIADAKRAQAVAAINVQEMEHNKHLMSQNELIHTYGQAEADRVNASNSSADGQTKLSGAIKNTAGTQKELNQQTRSYTSEVETNSKGMASWTAQHDEAVLAAGRLQTAMGQEEKAARGLAEAARQAAEDLFRMQMAYVPTIAVEGQLYPSKQGGYTQFNPAGYQIGDVTGSEISWQNLVRAVAAAPEKTRRAFDAAMAGGDIGAAVTSTIAGGLTTFGPLGQKPTDGGWGAPPPQVLDVAEIGLLQRAIALLPKEQQAGKLQELIRGVQAQPGGLEASELIQQLNDQITRLTTATEQNTEATRSMTDVLSPFYSQDPRKTHLGFRAFARGGIMTQFGELPLRHYQGGGMATSPQVAVFGEGSTPEAYVPVPSGRIPVELKMPANNNQRSIRVTINVMGAANASTVAALRQTAFQQAQAMRRLTG